MSTPLATSRGSRRCAVGALGAFVLVPFLSAALALSGVARANTDLVTGAPHELTASPAQPNAQLGRRVALDGDVLVATQPGELAALVFERTAGVWQQTAVLTAPLAELGAFALDAAIDGDVIAVAGADPELRAAAWIFERQGTSWTGTASVVLSDTDVFGFSVAVAASGDRVALGAPLDPDFSDRGQAAVYVRTGTSWSLEQRIEATDAADQDYFGFGLGLDGATLAVGAYGDDGLGTWSGSAYVYAFDGASWTLQQKLTVASPEPVGGSFGWCVSVSGSRLAVGAPFDGGAGVFSGSVRVFDRAGTSWTETATVAATDAAPSDGFGRSVALEGERLVVGASRVDAGALDSGAVYLYGKSGAVWSEEAKRILAAPTGSDYLADSVALSGDVLAAGAWGYDAGAPTAGVVLAFPFGTVAAFCDASDGALASCPCANPGAPDTGCDNAQGTGGVAAEVSALDPGLGTATINGTGFPAASTPTAIVLRGDDREAVPAAFFDGVRCVGLPGLVRLAATNAVGGVSTHAIAHGAGAGDYHYQVWYRNTPAGFCDASAASGKRVERAHDLLVTLIPTARRRGSPGVADGSPGSPTATAAFAGPEPAEAPSVGAAPEPSRRTHAYSVRPRP